MTPSHGSPVPPASTTMPCAICDAALASVVYPYDQFKSPVFGIMDGYLPLCPTCDKVFTQGHFGTLTNRFMIAYAHRSPHARRGIHPGFRADTYFLFRQMSSYINVRLN